ncbi:MAG: DnaJ domain-containing protein [Gammaproteobacteria bacterium]
MKKTLYDIFEVSPDANPEAIRNTYKSLVQRHHPDKNQGDPHAEEVLKAINFAYGVLSDPMKRLAYDASLAAIQGVQNPVIPSEDTPPEAAGKRADARRRGANANGGGGVSASETVESEVEQVVRVPAQSKNRLVVMLLLALLIGAVLVSLLPGGGGQDDVTSLAVTKPEHKLDVASGDQAAPALRSLTEVRPVPDRQATQIARSDSERRASTQTGQQNVDALPNKPQAKAEVVARMPIVRQNNVAAQSAKIQPTPQPSLAARKGIETPNAKPKDAVHPLQPPAGPQAKANEGSKKPVSEQGKAVAINTQGDAKRQGIPVRPSPQTGELPGKAVAQGTKTQPTPQISLDTREGVKTPNTKPKDVVQRPAADASQRSIPPEQFALQAEELPDKTAAQRDPMAQYKKGIMYEKGQGLPQDFSQAAHWYRQAAEQGIADAQYRLGKLYTVGKGVPIDNSEAYAWLSLAAAGNVEAAKPIVDYLASTMTPEQLANAKRRAAALRARHKR